MFPPIVTFGGWRTSFKMILYKLNIF
jgi:hypothetical protein